MQYVPWNWHEPSKGIFDFESEGRNITRFVEIAQEVGLLVLMRAGPFMCGVSPR
jgi:beta-galactosidase GanA